MKDGLQIPSLPSLHTLPQDFVDEALILSDILDLNEISSVELLLAGEQQLPRWDLACEHIALSNMGTTYFETVLHIVLASLRQCCAVKASQICDQTTST